MVYPPPAGGSGRINTKPKPARQQIAPQTTIRARPAPSTQVQKYSPPPPPPVTSSSSGQYRSPSPVPPPRQGNINPPGNQGGPVRNAAPQRPNVPRPAGQQAEAGKGGAIKRRQDKLQSAGFKAEKGKGGGGGAGGKKKGGGAPAAPVAPAPGPIQPPGLDEFLAGDVTYQSGMSGLMKALETLKAQNLAERGNVESAYTTATGRMAEERTRALKALQEDFASRGLLNSGMYQQANSDYDTSYNQQLGDLTADKQAQLQALIDAYGSGESENAQLLEQLRLEAIRRRADQYGITA